jgi:hypothetical protein
MPGSSLTLPTAPISTTPHFCTYDVGIVSVEVLGKSRQDNNDFNDPQSIPNEKLGRLGNRTSHHQNSIQLRTEVLMIAFPGGRLRGRRSTRVQERPHTDRAATGAPSVHEENGEAAPQRTLREGRRCLERLLR